MKCYFTATCRLSVLIIFSLLLQNCVPSNKDSEEFEKWTSTDPLSVHYKTRKQKFDNQNLVYNNSFEWGRVKKLDSLTHSIKVDGWELIGQSVNWINAEGDSVLKDSGLVYSGIHSIHVQRHHADEIESIGQGVLSDYIRVIPGNYLLSLYLNLKDIANPKSRLGTKIYDAVDIRILYYNKNKIQISRKEYSEYFNTKIDNSFKGLSFANFDKIDSTGWLHIIGRSHIFPHQDGDLQDDAKFVRVFIGLKGTGDLWADDIDFRYTKWNFTTLERISPYFDTTLSKRDLIVPQPVKVDILESEIYYRPYYKRSFPLILIPLSADKKTIRAAKELEKGIKDQLVTITGIDNMEIPDLIKRGIITEEDNASIVFSLGNNSLFNQYKKELPLLEILGKKEGYFIHSLDGLPSVVFLYGNSSIANYYAVQSALQLFDNKRLLYHKANVIDYPFWDERSFFIAGLNENSLSFFNTTNQTRLNHVYLPSESDKTKQIISDENDRGIFSKWLYYEIDPERNSSAKDLAVLKTLDNIYHEKIEGIALIFHSPLTENISLETAMDHSNTVCEQKLKNETLNSLDNMVHSFHVPVEFMPCISSKLLMYSNCTGSDLNSELFGIFKNRNTSYVWSGYDLQSWRIDEADLLMLETCCTYPKTFLDLTMYPKDKSLEYFGYDSLFPYKLLTASLFEPYGNEIVPEVYHRMEKIILAYNISNVFDRIRLQTASDFLWNPVSYNADLSLYKALVSEFGIEIAQDILKFNDLYFKIKSELIIASDPSANTKQHVRKASNLLNEVRILQNRMFGPKPEKSFIELNRMLTNLVKELEMIKTGMEKLVSVN